VSQEIFQRLFVYGVGVIGVLDALKGVGRQFIV
jgi:hypothetical protein